MFGLMADRALRWSLVLAAGAVCAPSPAPAAEITDVVDAADGTDPYDATLDLVYSRTLRRHKVTREFNCDPRISPDTCPDAWPGIGEMVHAKELRVQRTTHVLTPRAHLGIWHDLELQVDFPVVLEDSQEVRFAGDGGDPNGVPVDGNISTIAPDPDGPEDPPNLFDVPPKLPSRGGFGDMAMTLKWSPFNQERDDARATWTVFFTWGMPTGEVMRPGNDAVGRGVHSLTLGSSFSRRSGALDPYASMQGTMYVPADSSLFKDYKFAQEVVGPGAMARFDFGTEIIPYEDLGRRRIKVFLDVGLGGELHAEGRDYTDLFDAFAYGGRECPLDPAATVDPNIACYNRDSDSELHGQPFDGIGTVEPYGVIRAHLGFGFYTNKYMKLGADVSLAHETEHFASSADAGKDLDGSGLVENRSDGAGFDPDEQNPTYVPAVDAVGRRVRFEETTVFTAAFNASVIF